MDVSSSCTISKNKELTNFKMFFGPMVMLVHVFFSAVTLLTPHCLKCKKSHHRCVESGGQLTVIECRAYNFF